MARLNKIGPKPGRGPGGPPKPTGGRGQTSRGKKDHVVAAAKTGIGHHPRGPLGTAKAFTSSERNRRGFPGGTKSKPLAGATARKARAAKTAKRPTKAQRELQNAMSVRKTVQRNAAKRAAKQASKNAAGRSGVHPHGPGGAF
jgi:hypothetical protein